MTDTLIDPALERLAKAAGVTIDWVDAWGEPQRVVRDDLVAVIEALIGMDVSGPGAAEEATAGLLAQRPMVEPVLVAWDGRLEPVPVPVGATGAVVLLEGGGDIAAQISNGTARCPVLPLGYHRLVFEGADSSAHVFAAPQTAHPSPFGALGLISPTYSLRGSGRDVGLGTVAELRELADLCDDIGVSVVGTLPLLAAFPDQPSPYAPASRRAWNELFVDFSRVPGWSTMPAVDSTDRDWVDYDLVGHHIRSNLAEYARHVSATPRLRAEVDAFLAREPEMRRYATFRSQADDYGRNWRAWPDDITIDPDRVAYHETVQWIMQTQLADLAEDLERRGQLLYLDLPIGCHPDGFDVWDTPATFAPASLGAPPDTLFVGGQDWGLPALIPDKARLDGHANFRKAISRQLSVAGLLRIDHVMGIHRTWWVPHGAAATQGAYVSQPTEELFAIICLESIRARAGVVGENLGTVPPEIYRGLADHELLGMSMAQEARSTPTATDLVALSSHDTPSFPAWWKADDVDDLEDLGVFDAGRASAERTARTEAVDALRRRLGTDSPTATRNGLMRWMAGTQAAVVLLNLDDLIMEERRQNIPGTDWERPNWRVRHTRALGELAADPTFTDTVASIAARRPRTPAEDADPTAGP